MKDLAPANSPFQPSLSGYPNDFTVAVGYNSGALGATGLAIDTIGNVWGARYAVNIIDLRPNHTKPTLTVLQLK